MKKFKMYIVALFIGVFLVTTSCDNDDPQVNINQEEAFKLLAGQWTFGFSGSIVIDGTDVSANYPGFSLSFADGTYSTTNGANLFNASGTWAWADEQAKILTLDTDGLEIKIQTLTENRFVFTFNFAGATRAGVTGNYIVTVSK